jgi:hypothetical protein
MDLAGFSASLKDRSAPANLPPALEALWWAGKGDWDRAHRIVMGREGEADADWVHAYLHRVEGDTGNAHYWYRRAGKPPANGGLPEEWNAIAARLLDAATPR